MSKAAIYARVSTADKQNYERQISDLTPIIIKDGYSKDDIEIFGENISGYKKKDERPEFLRLLNIIVNNPEHFSCIYVTEISRLGRNPREARETVDLLIDLQIPLYVKTLNQRTIDETGKRNSVMSIILQVLMEFADMESQQMKERSKSGLLQSAKKGKAGGGVYLPYGYTKDENGMLVVDKAEAEVIKEIFELYKEGNGAKVISGILNEKGVPTRSQKQHGDKTINFNIPKKGESITWSDKTVLDIVSNSLYKGERRFKGNTFEAPAIISTDLFDECSDIRLSKTHRNYQTTYTYLLKDIITCGCCGRNYFAKYKPVPRGDKVYICSSRLKKAGNCGNVGVNISLIESAIYDQLLSTDTVLKYLSNTADIKKELEKDIKKYELQLKIDKKALDDKENEKQRLLKVYIAGHIGEGDFINNNKDIESSISSLTSKVSLMNDNLRKKKILLERQNDEKTTKKMLFDARDNRLELETIFKQIISKVVINKLNDKLVLASVFIQINGVTLGNSLKLVLNIASIKQRNKKYQYVPFRHFENEPIFGINDVLLNNIDDILTEVKSTLGYKIINTDWIDIDDDHILLVEPKRKAEN